MNDRRFPASRAQRLENPERLLWLPPAEVIVAPALRPGETIADVGAGTGYFSLPLPHAVGALGKVYAVDAQAELLSWLKQKLDDAPFTNVELIRAEADQTGLPTSSCSLFFLANVWHEIVDPIAALAEAMRVLKPRGRIAILDWRANVDPEHGPPFFHRVKVSDAMESLRSVGFVQVANAEVGRYSWLVQGEKLR
jgi:ubiquinone/menaquinone biosynthesis C-methylase UbiE